MLLINLSPLQKISRKHKCRSRWVYLNGRMFDGEVDGEVAWTLVSIQGRDDGLAVDNTAGRHYHQEPPLQNDHSISTMYNIVIGY